MAQIYDQNSSDCRVVRASASRAVDLGLITSRVKLMTLKLVFTASLLDAQHQRNSVENKPASLLVVLLGKALSGIPPCRRSRQQGCELDRFLTEFKFESQEIFAEFKFQEFYFSRSSSAKMTEFGEFKFEFAALDFAGRNGMNK